MKKLLKNDTGLSWFVIFGISLLLFGMACAFIFTCSRIYIGTFNIKDKVKLELNNTSASASEMIFKDLSEQNFTSYLDSFHQHEAELKRDFLNRLRKNLYLETSDYEIKQDTVKLSFRATDGYVEYIFECHADIKAYFLGDSRTLVSQKIYITAKHYYKAIENSEPNTDYINEPSHKTEQNIS